MRFLKKLLPDRSVPMRIWRGPFRGARIVMNPRYSLRKVAGLYEHELNGWLEQALPQVSRVIDVGANDGYFSFGCAAAFRRTGIDGEIIGIEAQQQHVDQLRASIAAQPGGNIRIVHAYAGSEVREGMVTLDSLSVKNRERTLIKIDVEGAEDDVIAGAQLWMHPSNRFMIEVHHERLLAQLTAAFAAHGHVLQQVNQQSLPLLGRELRDPDNWWLVSRLDPAG
jgi:precorrin-6B methylase 2